MERSYYTDAGDYDWGEPLDGAGDLDGDGYDDVVVGNEDALVGGKSNGIAYIVPGDAGRATGSETLSSASLRIYGDTYRRQRHLVGYVPQRESVDWDFPVNALDVVCTLPYLGDIAHRIAPGRKRIN